MAAVAIYMDKVSDDTNAAMTRVLVDMNQVADVTSTAVMCRFVYFYFLLQIG
jgi:hypothetical protein